MSKITFPVAGDYYKELRSRVDEYFTSNNLNKTGNWRMYGKTAVILTLFAASYVYLVFFAESLLPAIISAFILAHSFVLVGFNIMHDGNHESYSKRKWVNRLMGLSMDVIGGSSTIWKQKHNILHHTFTNIDGKDNDLDTNGMLRLSPDQRWRPWHRFQHWYAFGLYSFLSLSWMTVNDFQKYFSGRIGANKLKKFNASDTVLFFAGKAVYYGYMIVLPLFFHPLWLVLLFFVGIHLVLGFTLSIVFQLAHTVEDAKFPAPENASGEISKEWAVHQLETTADFARHSKLATWYMGGLNFQVEHHLFSKVCHIHYPAISKIVEETCREKSVTYVSYPTVFSAVRAHLRFLRQMSRAAA
jgi:linoleoyl-CoA desaturase